MKRLGVTMAAAVPLLIGMSGGAPADEPGLTPIEELGKFFFYDTRLSTPRGKQGCVSCHEPKVGWVLPLSEVNETTVGAPGAQPGAVGGRKTPSNAYVSFSPEFQATGSPFPPRFEGGNFWDGRAEGCGTPLGLAGAQDNDDADCLLGDGSVSETITVDDLPNALHVEYLGATADQALNPTFRPGVEQNTREKTVCQLVKTGPYKYLYEQVWGEPIDCKQQGDPPAYHTSFKRLAVAVAAWQASDDVNSFSSRRDACINQDYDPINGIKDADGKFPCDNLSAEANLGHDIFYGRNDTGENRLVEGRRGPAPLNAGCTTCHIGDAEGNVDRTGNATTELYSDHGYHCIGIPYNRDIPNNEFGADSGLGEHVLLDNAKGCAKTPTVRNVAKDELGITKAFMHNGYFKSLEQVVHWYNTYQDPSVPKCETLTDGDGNDISIVNATAAEAIAAGCWPKEEFTPQTPPGFGNLGLNKDEEAALTAYMEALTDMHTPTVPDMSRNSHNKNKK